MTSTTAVRPRASVAARLGGIVPQGRPLAEATWRRRHRFVCLLLSAHLPVLLVIGLARHQRIVHVSLDLVPLLACAVTATLARTRRAQSMIATMGLMACSAALVHLTGGLPEMHFHYFVMIAVITLYQRREPFLTGVAFVVLQHAVMGVVHPAGIYGDAASHRQPLLWATVHGGFILAASAAHLASWRLYEHQAQTDPLTGLTNRSWLLAHLEHRLADRQRTSSLSVLVLNLDRFRSVNDSHGQPIGDRFLEEIARRLVGAVRASDAVACFGGDEFGVVLEVATPEETVTVAERLLDIVHRPVKIDGLTLFCTTSIGVRTIDDSTDASTAMREADLAMSLAKARGGARLERGSADLATSARSHAALEGALRLAVTEERIDLHFQPIVDLHRGSVHAVEALARWHDPVLGWIPPDVFIPIAEAAGLMCELGRQVLRHACTEGALLSARSPAIGMHVNISAQQLAEPDFAVEVLASLALTGCPPAALTLELTESVMVRDLERAVQRLRQLRSIGVRVAIDDFGTGYSSLRYLRSLPADVVKIEKSFVDSIEEGVEVVRAIVDLAGSIGLDVVAEGIETEDQRRALVELGCSSGQGYLFSRPVPADELTVLLELDTAAGRALPSDGTSPA